MSSLNVNLPDDLRHFAEERAAEMGFPNTSAYVESLLVRESERRQAKLKLESELIRGLDSGPPIEAGEKYWAQKKADLTARHTENKK